MNYVQGKNVKEEINWTLRTSTKNKNKKKHNWPWYHLGGAHFMWADEEEFPPLKIPVISSTAS